MIIVILLQIVTIAHGFYYPGSLYPGGFSQGYAGGFSQGFSPFYNPGYHSGQQVHVHYHEPSGFGNFFSGITQRDLIAGMIKQYICKQISVFFFSSC